MFNQEAYPVIAKSDLTKIATFHSLRCDSKQNEARFYELDKILHKGNTVRLGRFLPDPLIKGSQPKYLEEGEGIPVISTLCIQKMSINIEDCRFISEDDFEELPENKKLMKGDVLLTMDGGTSRVYRLSSG